MPSSLVAVVAAPKISTPSTMISDQVADVRAATPTHAAEILAKAWARVGQLLIDRRQRLMTSLIARHAAARQRLIDLAGRRVLQQPLDGIRNRQQRLDELDQRAKASIRRIWKNKHEKFEATTHRLEALSPINVLSRGYSLTQTGDRRVVRNASDVAIGEILVTRIQRGQITSKVITAESGRPA
jgi:exodeoxyribonuclease VII large subunit